VNNIFAYIPSQITYNGTSNIANYSSNNNSLISDTDVQEVLQLSEKLAKKNQQLQTTVFLQGRIIAEQAEKVKVYDRIAASDDTMSVRDAAKVLQVKPSMLRNWLLDNYWVWHQASGYRVYQRILNQGLMKHRMRLHTSQGKYTCEVVAQVLITGKGLTYLGKKV